MRSRSRAPLEGPSRPTVGELRPQVEDQGAADQTEGEARRDESDKRRGCEECKNGERSAPRPASRSGGYLSGIRSPQYLPLEDVVGNVHTYEERCVEHDRRRRELSARNPCRCERQERHHTTGACVTASSCCREPSALDARPAWLDFRIWPCCTSDGFVPWWCRRTTRCRCATRTP